MGYGSANAFKALGQGIRGIGQIAGETKREREEEERQIEQEHYARKQDRFGKELTMIGMGGGYGDAPSQETAVIGRGAPTEAGSGLGSEGPATLSPRMPDLDRDAQVVTGGPYDEERYGTGGTGEDRYFWTRPEWQQRHDAEAVLEAAQRERDRAATSIGQGIAQISQLSNRSDEGFGTAAGGLISEGVNDPSQYLKGAGDDDDVFDPATDPALSRKREIFANPELYGGAAGSSRVNPGVDDVLDNLDTSGRGFWATDNGKTDMDRMQHAIAIANGEPSPFADEIAAFDAARGGSGEGDDGPPWYEGIADAAGAGFARVRNAMDPVEGIGRADPTQIRGQRPSVGAGARPDRGPGTHSIAPTEPPPEPEPGIDVRSRVGAGAEGQGIPPAGTQMSHNMADQPTLDTLWDIVQSFPDEDVEPYMIDNGWTPSDIAYIEGLMEERKVENRALVPEPGMPQQ